jgi:hypothetical protein
VARGSVRVTALTHLGRVASGFDATSRASKGTVEEAGGLVGAACIGGFRTSAAVGTLVSNWASKYDTQADVLREVGEKLAATASAYAHHDGTGADQFPAPAAFPHHPLQRRIDE